MPKPRKQQTVTTEELKELYSYDPLTGDIVNKVSRGSRAIKGRKCNPTGYVVLYGERISVSRLAWTLHNGEFPRGLVDHKNRKRWENHAENLRDCTNSENQRNRVIKNPSGFKGVTPSMAPGRWTAYIQVNWRRIYLGSFDTAAEAGAAYVAASAKYHGEFANLESKL